MYLRKQNRQHLKINIREFTYFSEIYFSVSIIIIYFYAKYKEQVRKLSNSQIITYSITINMVLNLNLNRETI